MHKLSAIALLFVAACAGAPAVLPSPQLVKVTSSASPAVASLTPTITPTADPYAWLMISSLAARSYGGGQIADLQVLSSHSSFTRHLISYPSDKLTVNGFVDIPNGQGPFPVVLVLHGYVEPVGYQVETYTARYAEAFANAGYIAIHPNYRNYPPSDLGPNDFRVGYAIDVLNLIALVNDQAGKPGLLQTANPDAVFLWGHSMGGGIALRVITVGADVQGAVLYGAMSGDEERNFERIRDVFSNGERGNEELTVPKSVVDQISPINFLDRIQVPVSIHHGDIDEIVPLAWSQELCTLLGSLQKTAECFTYHNMPHTFYGDNDELLIQRSIEFFERYTPKN